MTRKIDFYKDFPPKILTAIKSKIKLDFKNNNLNGLKTYKKKSKNNQNKSQRSADPKEIHAYIQKMRKEYSKIASDNLLNVISQLITWKSSVEPAENLDWLILSLEDYIQMYSNHTKYFEKDVFYLNARYTYF